MYGVRTARPCHMCMVSRENMGTFVGAAQELYVQSQRFSQASKLKIKILNTSSPTVRVNSQACDVKLSIYGHI